MKNTLFLIAFAFVGFAMHSQDLTSGVRVGYNISNLIRGNIFAMGYMVELRATRFVHPTLRVVAKEIAVYMNDEVGVPIHLDSESDRFDIKRGEHDITLK